MIRRPENRDARASRHALISHQTDLSRPALMFSRRTGICCAAYFLSTATVSPRRRVTRYAKTRPGRPNVPLPRKRPRHRPARRRALINRRKKSRSRSQRSWTMHGHGFSPASVPSPIKLISVRSTSPQGARMLQSANICCACPGWYRMGMARSMCAVTIITSPIASMASFSLKASWLCAGSR